MIEPKLYCIEAQYELDDEAYSVHTVGVDMDEETARQIASTELDLDANMIEILAFYQVSVAGFDITVTEKEK